MRFRMLGPVRVRHDAAWVPVPAEQQRVVLAVLLADAGRTVSTERLVDAVWPDRPPRRAVNTVQSYVMRLRQRLEGDSLVTRGRGYELVVGANDVDAMVFERLVAAGRQDLDAGRADAGARRLARALAQWRGRVFSDVPDTAELTARAAQLEQLRLTAEEDHAGALLALDRPDQVVDDLHRLVDHGPLRERRWVMLMQALHECGRRSEALGVFRRARQVLSDELGIEPGPQLQELHRALLSDHPAGERVVLAGPPAQLPPGVAPFVGRRGPLRRLDALVDGEPATAVVIAAIAGPPGVGKTTLAVHWAHQMRHRFVDGQLYVNLRGYAAGPPVRPIEALVRLLRALGVPPEQVPSDVDEASALYRSRLADRRVIVLLDNACDADQVRPLLPGHHDCLALVTSRDELTGLIARDGAVPIPLDVLADGEAQSLLSRLLGRNRTTSEPQAVAQLARYCGNLPLALRLAAANLMARPHVDVAEYVGRLRHDRLGGLEAGGDGMRAAFGQSYATLPDPARRLFRLLGLVPGADLTARAAAALAAVNPAEAAGWLDQLRTAHLVEEYAPGRFRTHDLLRHYAAERVRSEEPDRARDDARERLFDHYLSHTAAASAQLFPEYIHLPDWEPGSVGAPDRAEATAWLEAELANLVAIIVHTAEHGPHEVAWRLAFTLRGHFRMGTATPDWQVVAEAGLAAAQADGGARALAGGHLGIAQFHWVGGRFPAAIEHDRQAAAHARAAGWAFAEAAALADLGTAYGTLGDLTAAADHLARSLAIRRRLDWPLGEALVLSNLGCLHAALGRLDVAAEHFGQAAVIFRKQGAPVAEARANGGLAEVYHALGRFDDALDRFGQALAAVREAGDRYEEGIGLAGLSEVYRELGRGDDARACAVAAGVIADEVGSRALRCLALSAIAGAHIDAGQPEAIDEYEQALRLARQMGHRLVESRVLIGLAEGWRERGRPERAAELAQQAIDVARTGGYRMSEGQAITVLATACLDLGDARLAADLAGRAATILAESGHRPGRDRAEAVAASARAAG